MPNHKFSKSVRLEEIQSVVHWFCKQMLLYSYMRMIF